MRAVTKSWLTFAILAALTGACGDSGGSNDGDTGGGATAGGATAGGATAGGATAGGATAGGATAGGATAGGATAGGATAGGATAGGATAGGATAGGATAGGATAGTDADGGGGATAGGNPDLPAASECGAQADGTPVDSTAKGGCYYFYCYQTEASLLAESTSGGKCANAKDVAIQCEGESVRTVSQCARDNAASLALSGADGFAKNVTTCARKNAKLADFSDDCLACNVQSSVCAAQKCLGQCVTGDSEGCDKCREDNGCTPAFYACAGLPDPNM